MKYSFVARNVAATGLVLGLLAGSASGIAQVSHAAAATPAASASGTVGFLVSDFTTSARWKIDRDQYIAALKKIAPNVTVSVQDAKNSQTTQQAEAQSLITAGAKVLVVVPVDAAGAAQIVRLAHAHKPSIPVIAYDRLITGASVDAYASFDGYAVGQQQGQYLRSKVAKGGTIVSLGGAPTDNNAQLFYNGAMSVLKPLFASGYYKNGYSQFTPNWDPSLGQAEMAAALLKLNNKVDGVLSPNDGIAGGVITALKAKGLAGKVPVTGQDATIAGLQQILLGNQSMTIYKPYKNLATNAATITDLFLNGKSYTSPVMTDNGAGKVPTILLKTIVVDKSNIKSTILADGLYTKNDICSSIPASACTSL